MIIIIKQYGLHYAMCMENCVVFNIILLHNIYVFTILGNTLLFNKNKYSCTHLRYIIIYVYH